MNANNFIVKNAPNRICYIPEFITKEEEQSVLKNVYSSPKPKWEYLLNRRLQQWGGIVGNKCLIADNNIPKWLVSAINKISEIENAFSCGKPNHVLINEYLPGQGIMPHNDGPVFFPFVSTISLGSHTFLSFYKLSDENLFECRKPIGSLLLQPRSLVLISESAYTQHLHGIEETEIDEINESVLNRPEDISIGTCLKRSTRVSLTMRNVPVVNKNLFKNLLQTL